MDAPPPRNVDPGSIALWFYGHPGYKYTPHGQGGVKCLTFTPSTSCYRDCPDCGASMKRQRKLCRICKSTVTEEVRIAMLKEIKAHNRRSA